MSDISTIISLYFRHQNHLCLGPSIVRITTAASLIIMDLLVVYVSAGLVVQSSQTSVEALPIPPSPTVLLGTAVASQVIVDVSG